MLLRLCGQDVLSEPETLFVANRDNLHSEPLARCKSRFRRGTNCNLTQKLPSDEPRPHVRFGRLPVGRKMEADIGGRFQTLLLDFGLLRNCQRIIGFDAEVTNRALELSVA